MKNMIKSSSPGPRPRRPPTISRSDEHISYWLRRVSNEISHSLGIEFQNRGLTLAEWLVLRELYDGERRPVALAAKLGLTRGAISKLARRLVASLMITQEADPGDGRGQMLALSGLGHSAVTVLAGIMDDNDKELFGHLTPDTRALLLAVLRDIIRRRGLRAPPADRGPDWD